MIELKKVLINRIKTTTKPDGSTRIINRIPLGFTATRALGFASYILLSENRGFFITSIHTLDKVYEKLSKEQDEYVCNRLEHELRTLDRQIILESGELYSLDSLIQQAKEKKQSKRRSYQSQDYSYQANYAPNRLAASNGVLSDRPLTMSELDFSVYNNRKY